MRSTYRTTRNNVPEYCPTPEEIQVACREIQSEWTEEDRRRRSGGLSAEKSARIRRMPLELQLLCDYSDAA